MKLKRIFMTGVLASSMLALAACGDDVEGKPAEETPAEEKEKEVAPVQPVDPVEPEEDKFTLSDALTALNNFSIEGYLQNLLDKYAGEDSYINIVANRNGYEYKDSSDKTGTKYESNAQYIVTLDEATKIYGKSFNGQYEETEYDSLIKGIATMASISKTEVSHKVEDITSTAETNIEKLIASTIEELVFEGNVLESSLPLAEKADLVKGKVTEYLSGKVKEVNGVEVIDVPAIIGDVEDKVSEKTAGIDAGATLLSLAAPFIIYSKQVEDKTDLTTIHDAYPMGFIYLDYDLKDKMTVELSVDKDLLAMVLNDYKGETILKLLADAYSTDEAQLTEQNILEKFTTGKLGGVLALLNKALASTMGEGFDITKAIQYYASAEIQDDIIGLASMCDFNLSYAITEGTFATKVNVPVVITNEDPSKTQIMPLFAYISYANGELVALAGQDVSTDKADAETLAKYKGYLGIASDNELLLRDFLGNGAQPMGYVTYLADATDENKSVLEVNAMIFDYMALITKTENGVDVDIQSMKLDDKGDPVKDKTTGKYVFEKVGSLSYTNDETGTIFDAAYGYMDKNEQNEDVFTKVISLTYANSVEAGLSFNAYYQGLFELEATDNSMTLVKLNKTESTPVGSGVVIVKYYDVIELKFNTEDALVELSIKQYDQYPAKDSNIAPIDVNVQKLKKIENGYEYVQELTHSGYEENVSCTITKEDTDDNSVYLINMIDTTDSNNTVRVNTLSLVADEAAKSIEFSKSSDTTYYKIENEQKVVDEEIKDINAIELKLAYDEENKKVVSDFSKNDKYGRLSKEIHVEVSHETDAEDKEALIKEVEDGQAANEFYDLNLTVTDLKAVNTNCVVRNNADGKVGTLKDYTLTIDKDKHKVGYTGTLVITDDEIDVTVGCSNVNYEIAVSGNLALNNYYHEKNLNLLYLYTDDNKVNSVVAKQNVTYNGNTYFVTYEGTSYSITDADGKPAELDSLSDMFDSILEKVNKKIAKFDDSILEEVDFNLPSAN